MVTSAEQLHGGSVDTADPVAAQCLYIDLDVCAAAGCANCSARCSYHFHPDNNGVRSIAELATYHLVCRRCETPHCVAACPVGALEQQPEEGKVLIRHAMRCVSCGSCSHACPYGTVYPEYVPLLAHTCDYCLDRREEDGEPLCVQTCPYGALHLASPERDDEDHTALVGKYLLVHVTHWKRN